MKILIVNSNDISGGAARAAYRLHRGLKSLHLDSKMFVQNKVSADEDVLTDYRQNDNLGKIISRARPNLDSLRRNSYRQRKKTPFSTQLLPNKSVQKINQIQSDVVNLHWISGGFIPIVSLANINAPIVWTLHDMWAFTGGCHYTENCTAYIESCGNCPQLVSGKANDLSRQIWNQKQKSWQKRAMTIVTPSSWLARCARESSLFADQRIEVIHNGIDTDVYKPIDKKLAREILNLPPDKKLILFGAGSVTSDQRKGFQHLIPALTKLTEFEQHDNFELIIFGTSKSAADSPFPFKTNYLGKFADDISLAMIYSAADVFVAPSVQDNLPNTVMEALACGIPSLAFNIGGMPDMIEHEKNGYLAQPFDTFDLAQGIAWILENDDRHRQLSQQARQIVEKKFTLEHQAQNYLQLYNSVL